MKMIENIHENTLGLGLVIAFQASQISPQGFMTRKYGKQENSTKQVGQHEALRVLSASLSKLLVIKTMGEAPSQDKWVSPKWGHNKAYSYSGRSSQDWVEQSSLWETKLNL